MLLLVHRSTVVKIFLLIFFSLLVGSGFVTIMLISKKGFNESCSELNFLYKKFDRSITLSTPRVEVKSSKFAIFEI